MAHSGWEKSPQYMEVVKLAVREAGADHPVVPPTKGVEHHLHAAVVLHPLETEFPCIYPIDALRACSAN